MTHVDDGTIQSYLHGELPEGEREQFELHSSSCGTCAEHIAMARREDDWIKDRLASLNASPPGHLSQRRVARGRSSTWTALGRAAVLLALVIVGGGGVAWALTAGRARLRAMSARPNEVPASMTSDTAASGTFEHGMTNGLAVVPSSRFSVTFEAAQDSGKVSIAIEPTDTVTVRAADEKVSFESRSDGIVIRNRGATGDHELSIPAGPGFIEVRLGDVTLFSRANGIVRSMTTPDSHGRYVIPLSAGERSKQ